MEYNIELSILLTEPNFANIKSSVEELADFYFCDNIYAISDQEGRQKIPIYNYIFIVNFTDNFDNFIHFLTKIKSNKSVYIDCIYNTCVFKLLYASSNYLKGVDKELTKKYKEFIKEGVFTANETLILNKASIASQ